MKAEQICRMPLKLWKHLQMSATAVNFSMAETRSWVLGCETISEATRRDILNEKGSSPIEKESLAWSLYTPPFFSNFVTFFV